LGKQRKKEKGFNRRRCTYMWKKKVAKPPVGPNGANSGVVKFENVPVCVLEVSKYTYGSVMPVTPPLGPVPVLLVPPAPSDTHRPSVAIPHSGTVPSKLHENRLIGIIVVVIVVSIVIFITVAVATNLSRPGQCADVSCCTPTERRG
jgi:hypothetical protein